LGLKNLLSDVAGLTGGVDVAIEMLDMYFFCHREDQTPTAPELIDIGGNLLLWLDLNNNGRGRDSNLKSIIRRCLAGSDAEGIAQQVCRNVRSMLDARKVSRHNVGQLLDGLFNMQPVIALTEFFLGGGPNAIRLRTSLRFGDGMPIEKIAPDVLTAWANQDACPRYKLLSQALDIFIIEQREFIQEQGEEPLQLSSLFLALLDKAPDKPSFLGHHRDRFIPRVWSGSLADVLVKRREAIRQLGDHPDNTVRQWVADMEAPIAEWIDVERQSDRRHEESFE
jgi:hypothetical protein